MNARDGLVVVVPGGWRGDVEAVVSAKRRWAERALGMVAEQRALHLGGPAALMPAEVELRFAGERLPVRTVPAGRPCARVAGGELVVAGAADPHAALDALRRWLDRTAREVLPMRLEALSAEHGITYERCRVGRARSRWGSCSARKTISLNRNLVFLEPELVDALMLHELAHLDVMDHSPRFWARLSELDPAWRAHRATLKEAGRHVPAWADA